MRSLVFWLCTACGSSWAPVGPMLLEARNNDLAATTNYRSKELALAGSVVSTGEKKIEHGASRTDGQWTESLATDADTPYPFVQIRDPDRPSPDVVTCYFTERDGAPGKLAYGTPVHVRGFFREFVVSAGHVDAVLAHCSFEPVK